MKWQVLWAGSKHRHCLAEDCYLWLEWCAPDLRGWQEADQLPSAADQGPSQGNDSKDLAPVYHTEELDYWALDRWLCAENQTDVWD